MPNTRVNFVTLTPYPRKNEDGEIILYSCSSVIRDHDKHKTLDVVCQDLEEVKELREVGVVELSEIDTYEDHYEDKDGEDATSLNCTFGSIRGRGDW